MTSKRERRERLFDTGSDSITALFRTHTSHYICPLCVTMFDRGAIYDGRLTLDHVPPTSIGSRCLVLTCEPCNSTAGHQLDAHRWRLERLFGGGRARSPVRGPVDVRVASLSDLRSAYLIAFAALGYSWALSPALRIVREQIAHPEAGMLSNYHLQLDPGPSREFVIAVLDEPRPALWVQLRSSVILLPCRNGKGDFFEALASDASDRQAFRGSRLAWPKYPRYALDHSSVH